MKGETQKKRGTQSFFTKMLLQKAARLERSGSAPLVIGFLGLHGWSVEMEGEEWRCGGSGRGLRLAKGPL